MHHPYPVDQETTKTSTHTKTSLTPLVLSIPNNYIGFAGITGLKKCLIPQRIATLTDHLTRCLQIASQSLLMNRDRVILPHNVPAAESQVRYKHIHNYIQVIITEGTFRCYD